MRLDNKSKLILREKRIKMNKRKIHYLPPIKISSNFLTAVERSQRVDEKIDFLGLT